jgi:hypothetical protein
MFAASSRFSPLNGISLTSDKKHLSTSRHFPRSSGILGPNCDPAFGFFHTRPLLQNCRGYGHAQQQAEYEQEQLRCQHYLQKILETADRL